MLRLLHDFFDKGLDLRELDLRVFFSILLLYMILFFLFFYLKKSPIKISDKKLFFIQYQLAQRQIT